MVFDSRRVIGVDFDSHSIPGGLLGWCAGGEWDPDFDNHQRATWFHQL